MSKAACSACGVAVADGGGFRVTEPEAERHAVFCSLDHVALWAQADGAWLEGSLLGDDEPGDGLGRCADCGDGLSYGRVLLVRHSGPFRIADALCGVEHLTAWAKAGGRWRVG